VAYSRLSLWTLSNASRLTLPLTAYALPIFHVRPHSFVAYSRLRPWTLSNASRLTLPLTAYALPIFHVRPHSFVAYSRLRLYSHFRLLARTFGWLVSMHDGGSLTTSHRLRFSLHLLALSWPLLASLGLSWPLLGLSWPSLGLSWASLGLLRLPAYPLTRAPARLIFNILCQSKEFTPPSPNAEFWNKVCPMQDSGTKQGQEQGEQAGLCRTQILFTFVPCRFSL
jgi:hypothetical protein